MALPRLPSVKSLACITALFFAATFAVYGASLQNEFVSWDDNSLIQDNPIIESMNVSTLKKAFTSYDPELYIPLTFVSYQIDHAFGGFRPFAYHATNLLLHTLNALLVSWLLFLLLENGWLAIALGMLFALHPLNTEAVAWASARKDVLSTFFFLGSLIGYVYATERHSREIIVLSLALSLLGLLSKVMVVTLPAVVFLIDWMRHRPLDRTSVTEKIPYVALSLIFGVIAVFGKTTVLVSSTLWQKILMAGKSTAFYVQKFFVPEGLSVVYPYTKSITLASPDFFVPATVTILLLASVWFLWNRNRNAAVGLAFFLVTLIPTFINFAKGGDMYFASDRYAYVPMIGLLIVVGSSLQHWLASAETVRASSSRRNICIGASLCILLASGIAAAKQSRVWENSVSLYEHALAYYPNARVAENNLGMEQMIAGNLQSAVASFHRALAIQPDPRTKVNLAAAYVKQNRLSEAREIYEAVMASDPDLADTYYGIGNLYQKQGDLKSAAAEFQKAIDVDPEYFNAYNNLGAMKLQLGDFSGAVSILEKSIELRPNFVESYYNLALALRALGENERAEALLQQVVAMNPADADAFVALAELSYEKKLIDDTASYLKQAFAIDRNNRGAYELLLKMKHDGYVQ